MCISWCEITFVESMFLVCVGICETFKSFRIFPKPAGNGAVPVEAILSFALSVNWPTEDCLVIE
jgi:hypothetical protein